jgi:hypothetical protein
MEGEFVNFGVRNINGKEGRSSYPYLSVDLVLAAVFICLYTVTVMRLGVASVSRVLDPCSSYLCGVKLPQLM